MGSRTSDGIAPDRADLVLEAAVAELPDGELCDLLDELIAEVARRLEAAV